jgi:hypothetical protein
LLDLIVVTVIFVFSADVAIPCPRVFHNWRR